MGRIGTYAAEVKVSGFWLDIDEHENVILDLEWSVEDESFDAYNGMGESKLYPSYGTYINKIHSAYGEKTGADYTKLLETNTSSRFLDHLCDVVNETYEC